MKHLNMKKNIIALLLLSVFAIGCTRKFEEYNRPLYGATDEQMATTPIGGGELQGLMTWVIPNQENGFQMTFSLIGGPLSGYASATGFVNDFARYTPRSGWVSYPFNDTFSGHLYNHYRYLANKTNSDIEEPSYALAVVLRVAISHYLSDIYGPIPYSKISGVNLRAPYDTQEELYTNMLSDLKKASMALDNTSVGYNTYSDFDNVYGSNLHKWADYARSLMLRMCIRISGVAPDMAREYAEWAVANGVITANENNASISSIDNPLYKIENDWSDSALGADIVEYLKAYNDPRLPAMVLPGSGGDYVGFRTPAESKKDAKILELYAHTNIKANSEIPWLTASEVAFLKAEGTLLGWQMGGEDAKTLYEDGIRLSFEQWGVTGVDDYLKTTETRKGYVDPYDSDLSLPDFKSDVTVDWDSADGDVEAQKAMIATQKWIALYPYNTIEAWAEWRRTGYPNLMPAVVNGSGGAVEDIHQVDGRDRGGMRRIVYPQEELQNNAEGVAIGINDLGGKDSYATDLWWAK